MVRTRIIKKQDKSYIELPSEMAKYDEVEVFLLKDGYCLVSVPLNGQETKSGSALSDSEMAILKKLLAIKFENRTAPYILKTFNGEELEILRDLEKKGFVNLFKGRKYVDGVYNIPASTYSLVQKNEPARSVQQPSGTQAILNTKGFVIVTDKREALTLSEQLSQEMKKGEVFGIKGFDNRFYIVGREYFTTARAKILAFLKQDSDLQSISSSTKLDGDGCNAVLKIMAENGDIIEKKRGVFASV